MLNTPAPFRAGILVFPLVTQLDFTGPYEVLCRAPNASVDLVAKRPGLIETEHGLHVKATAGFTGAPRYDLILVPGGPGVNALLNDRETLEYLTRAAAGADYVASVCTGSLVLAAAGLLQGRRAASHWASRDFLPLLGAEKSKERVCRDGRFFTGGGVTAGIDVALAVVGERWGRAAAERIQVMIEYQPPTADLPPHPEHETAVEVREAWRETLAARQRLVEEAARRLDAARTQTIVD